MYKCIHVICAYMTINTQGRAEKEREGGSRAGEDREGQGRQERSGKHREGQGKAGEGRRE